MWVTVPITHTTRKRRRPWRLRRAVRRYGMHVRVTTCMCARRLQGARMNAPNKDLFFPFSVGYRRHGGPCVALRHTAVMFLTDGDAIRSRRRLAGGGDNELAQL